VERTQRTRLLSVFISDEMAPHPLAPTKRVPIQILRREQGIGISGSTLSRRVATEAGIDIRLLFAYPTFGRGNGKAAVGFILLPLISMDEHRKKALIVIAAAILAARRLAAAPRNSPAYMSALSDAVSDAKKIIERVERES